MNTPIPIVLLTGFLGTGKTTLLRHLLSDPRLHETAVLINELGEIGLDHQLVFGEGGIPTRDRAAGIRSALLLANGCVCCTVRDDLAIALDDLLVERSKNVMPAFERVIIETTGLANPVPIIESLRASPIAAEQYRLAQIVCTVDAAAPAERLDLHPESLAQVVVADTLLLTRSDLATSEANERLRNRLRGLNPQARLITVTQGRIDPDVLFATNDDDVPGGAALDRALALPISRPPLESIGAIRPLFHATVRTQTLRFSGPSVWGDTQGLIEAMAAESGDTLLRVKGVLRLAQYPHPMVVQYAGGRLSPIEPLPGALADGDAGYLVIISARR